MATIRLQVDDTALRLTLMTMLQAAGYRIGDGEADVLIGDLDEGVIREAERLPTLVLTTAATIDKAVRAMEHGAFGYIFLPLQAGEAELMVRRALSAWSGAPGNDLPADMPLTSLEEIENHHLQSVLRQCKGNQAKAARILGIGRNTLWRKLKKIRGQAEEDESQQ